ncbi:hypothetical protein HanIR_Chr15g0736801 [Helianthus annuus]|nr:hypothetical protein HanIR_Chr15g0736801 [Helianthus annuus]
MLRVHCGVAWKSSSTSTNLGHFFRKLTNLLFQCLVGFIPYFKLFPHFGCKGTHSIHESIHFRIERVVTLRVRSITPISTLVVTALIIAFSVLIPLVTPLIVIPLVTPLVTTLTIFIRGPTLTTLITRLKIQVHLIRRITIPEVRVISQTRMVSVGVHVILLSIPIHLVYLLGVITRPRWTLLGSMAYVSTLLTYCELNRIHFLLLHTSHFPL